jgi:hypothetical protein
VALPGTGNVVLNGEYDPASVNQLGLSLRVMF